MPNSVDLPLCRRVLGTRLLTYALANVEVSDTEVLTQGQIEAATILAVFATAADGEREGHARAHKIEGLLSCVEGTSTTWLAAARKAAGAALPVTNEVDVRLVTELSELCLAFFPRQYFPLSSTPMLNGPGNSVYLYHHPSSVRLQVEVYEDADLGGLFQGHPPLSQEDTGTWRFASLGAQITLSSGMGTGVQMVGLPAAMINYAFILWRLRDGVEDDIRAVAAETIDTARSLARGDATALPLVTAIAGVKIDPPAFFTVGPTTVRHVDEVRDVLPIFDGNTTAAMVASVPVRVLSRRVQPDLTSFEDWSAFTSDFERHQRAVRELLDRTRLSLLLASTDLEVVTPAELGQIVLNPLTSGSSWSGSGMPSVGVTSTLSSTVGDAAQAWWVKLENHPASLWLGSRRLLSAATSRLDPLDGFVDAVICWENMYGSGGAETTFRVCGAMARVLEPEDHTRRGVLFRELKKLYEHRSKLVHGAKVPSPQEAGSLRDRAVRLAIASLSAMYERPDLLSAESSALRGQLAMLEC